MTPPDLTPPPDVLAARDDLAKYRAAIARQNEIAADNAAQLTATETDHRHQCSDAAFEGRPAPKPPGAIKSLSDAAKDSANALADLKTREQLAKGAYTDAVQTWGWKIVRAQIADDVRTGRKGLELAAAAIRAVVDSLGEQGFHLLREMLEAMPPDVRFARVERINKFNGIFSSVGSRNPAQDIGPGMLIEAGCPTADEARRLAQTPPEVSA